MSTCSRCGSDTPNPSCYVCDDRDIVQLPSGWTFDLKDGMVLLVQWSFNNHIIRVIRFEPEDGRSLSRQIMEEIEKPVSPIKVVEMTVAPPTPPSVTMSPPPDSNASEASTDH